MLHKYLPSTESTESWKMKLNKGEGLKLNTGKPEISYTNRGGK